MNTTLVHLTPDTVFAQDFKVVRPLAEGGMGAVYVVQQLSTGKERALKLMHPQLVADPAHRARFAQEARMGALIESDHVVEVVAAGVDEATQTPWIAMELLRGEDLAARLERGALPPREAHDVMRQLGHALGAAHRAGLVHRDVKPENVFLARSRREGEQYVVKVLDFGIAKVMQDARVAATATGAMGSPSWMAPEQTEVRGRIGPQADVWAMGLLGFCMLTARIYWNAANTPDASLQSLMREMLFEPLAPASVRAAQLGVGGAIPQGFDEWFARCVARDPAARFPDASQATSAFVAVFANTQPTAIGFAPTPVAPPSAPAEPVRAPTHPMPGGSAPMPTIVGAPISMTPPGTPSTMIWDATKGPAAAVPVVGASPSAVSPVRPPVPAAPPQKRSPLPFVLAGVVLSGVLAGGAYALFHSRQDPDEHHGPAHETQHAPTQIAPVPVPVAPVPAAPVPAADVTAAPVAVATPSPPSTTPTAPTTRPRPTRPVATRPTTPTDADPQPATSSTPPTPPPTTPPAQPPAQPTTPQPPATTPQQPPTIPPGIFPPGQNPLDSLLNNPALRAQRLRRLEERLQQTNDPAQREQIQRQIDRLRQAPATP